MNLSIRKWWQPIIRLNWKFGLFLILLICVPRFLLVLQANRTGIYNMIGLIMLISALLPFVFLNKKGIKSIGIRKTNRWLNLLLALITGLIFSFLLYWLGEALYGNSFHNWYAYIGKSYNISPGISAVERKIMFFIMAGTAMTFSPVGEEFFFRGIVHGSFAHSLGERRASLVDSAAFAITHVAHFGLVFVYGCWQFYLVPTLIWVLSMFLVSLLFFQMKKSTGSIWGAVICHSGFNCGMVYSIFYL